MVLFDSYPWHLACYVRRSRHTPIMGSPQDLMARVSNRGGTTSLIRHLQILRTVTEAVSRSLDLNEVIQKSLSALTDVTGHEIASLHLVSVDGKMLLLRGERGLSDRLRETNQMLPMGQGLIGRVGPGAPRGRGQPRPRSPARRARRGLRRRHPRLRLRADPGPPSHPGHALPGPADRGAVLERGGRAARVHR